MEQSNWTWMNWWSEIKWINEFNWMESIMNSICIAEWSAKAAAAVSRKGKERQQSINSPIQKERIGWIDWNCFSFPAEVGLSFLLFLCCWGCKAGLLFEKKDKPINSTLHFFDSLKKEMKNCWLIKVKGSKQPLSFSCWLVMRLQPPLPRAHSTPIDSINFRFSSLGHCSFIEEKKRDELSWFLVH